jgi:hypothetical protein
MVTLKQYFNRRFQIIVTNFVSYSLKSLLNIYPRLDDILKMTSVIISRKRKSLRSDETLPRARWHKLSPE